jgi:dTMP kinase
MKKGLFITFEGIDGCGKSTQAERLADYIFGMSKYNHVLKTREPYDNEKIRKMLRETDDPYSQAKELAKMFTDDRKLHVKDLITPSLKKGVYVISDRYSFSTLAYQQTQGVQLKTLLNMHKNLPIPDIVFIVDVPVEVALKRMHKDGARDKGKEHKFEKDKAFMIKLRQNYLDLKPLPKHNVIIIDGSKNIDEIFNEQIKPVFDKLCEERNGK